MADVRSLLRSERAQRRINHSYATYSATGSLECSVCHMALKSDQEVWNKHLKSTQHAMRAERLRLNTSRKPEQATTHEVSNGSKKRKASDGEDDSRKRTKPVVDVPGGFFDEMIEANNISTGETVGYVEEVLEPREAINDPTPTTTTLPSHPPPTPSPAAPAPNPIDEDEWAAFERDVATPPPDPHRPSALTAEATIIAAPMTAAELAAQAREEANTQTKERREAEIEGEKEDAARALEEEFDEMEELEERVKRLREMREALRVKKAQEAAAERVEGQMRDDGGGGGELEEESEDEEEEYDDEWSVWAR